MAGSLNRVMILGNLCADPEVRHTQSGGQIVNMRIATSESWKDKSTGEKKERPEFHSIVIFNEALGKVAAQYLKKGSRCFISGALQTRKWTDNSGNDRYTTEIVLQNFNGELVLLDGKSEGSASSPGNSTPRNGGQANKSASGRFDQRMELDDERPF